MKFYITTSIAYANASPHIGFALELLQADVLARYKRKKGEDVFFLTGTDEHGLKIYKKAKEEKKDPREFVDEIYEEYKSLLKKLDISNDFFIRTTDKETHIKGVKEVWKELEENGDIYKKKYRGLYCRGCEAFKKEKELISGKCPDHGIEPEVVEEENYFFKLSKYKKEIKEAINSGRVGVVPKERKNEVLRFLEEGLEDISISRLREVLPWGISVPGDESQTIYVWIDALSNYITALGYKEKKETFKKYWPADVHVIGKDILRFHAVILLGVLLSLDLDLPKKIFVHGHITYDGEKMSKTLGNVVSPFDLVNTWGTDAVRYYLLREIPSMGDGDFSEEKFKGRYNADLANGLGNLVSRTTALLKKGNININELESKNIKIKKEVEKTKQQVEIFLEKFNFSGALNSIWNLIHFADRYIEEKKPWEKNGDREEVVEDLFYILRFIAEEIAIFLPQTSEKIENSIKNKKKVILFSKR